MKQNQSVCAAVLSMGRSKLRRDLERRGARRQAVELGRAAGPHKAPAIWEGETDAEGKRCHVVGEGGADLALEFSAIRDGAVLACVIQVLQPERDIIRARPSNPNHTR